VRRVSVVGSAGSGKTTVGRRVAASLDLPFVELDGLFWHRPGWVSRGREDFRAAVAAETAREGWVVDGNYSSAVQDIVWSRADTVVWLDLARAIVMLQIVVRTLGRVVRRRELWNGNRERWRNVLTLDPENSVIAWSWQQYPRRRREYERAVTDPAWRHLRIVRLRSRREVRRFLRDLDGRH
jgi:adenylate kinase family enzyme